MERREPIIEEESEAEPEPEPQPENASVGGVRPPGRIGGGLHDDEGNAEPPSRGGGPHWSDPNIINMPIEDLNLSMRAYNGLRRSGLMTVGQVIERSEDELLSLQNFGRKSYDELREQFDELGILDSREALPQDTGGGLRPWVRPDDYPDTKQFLRRLDEDPPTDPDTPRLT